MNVGSIGSPNVDFSRHQTAQQTQKQEAVQLEVEKATSVPQAGSSQKAESRSGSGAGAQTGSEAAAQMRSAAAAQANTKTVAQTGSTATPQKDSPAAAQAGSTAAAQGGTSATAQAQAAQQTEKAKSNGGGLSKEEKEFVINKANAGSVLTEMELSRLKEADPGLHTKVTKAEQARLELKKEMQQSPSNAKQVAQMAIASNNSEGQEITRKALAEEYGSFASKYDQVELSGRVMR